MYRLILIFFSSLLLWSASLFAQPKLLTSKVERNIVYGMYSGLALMMDVYYPKEPNGIGIVHISGSGFTRPMSYDAAPINQSGHVKLEGGALVEAGYTLFTINHRAIPRFRYPAAVEDVQRAVRYIRYHAERFGIDPDHIGAIGGSSGGYLVSMLGLLDGKEMMEDASPINRTSAKVQAVIARAAPINYLEGLDGTAFLGARPQEVQRKKSEEYQLAKEASPISHVSTDDPPFLLMHGDQDDVIPYVQAEMLEAELRKAGVPVRLMQIEGAGHGPSFPGAKQMPDLDQARVDWMDTHLKEKTKSRSEVLPPPNILWITNEDISPNLGCYGDTYAKTPYLDKLAQEGVLYTNAFASAPVCAVARSSIISGMFSQSIGTQHMRCAGRLPSGAALYPTLLRQAGYYCSNNVKTDYNLDMDNKSIWDDCSRTAHWRNRPDRSKPFFSIFNFTSSHESRVNDKQRYKEAIAGLNIATLKLPGDVPLPPYYPDTKEVRELWARYYNIITAMDKQVGEILDQLQADGLAENTIVIYYSDHGAGIPRHKRWLYDTGLQVPLIVKVPAKYQNWSPNPAGTQTDELVSFLDLPATALKLAGVDIPDYYQGRAFLGENLSPERDYIYAGRDRMDERYDMQRAVRDKRYKYICYYEAYQPFCQYMNTPEKGAIMQAIRQAAENGSLPEAGQHIVAQTKPREELFDLENDPYELNNLADSPAHQDILKELRAAHGLWSDRIKDTGLIPETILRRWEREQNASIYDIMRSQAVPVTEIRETAVGERTISQLQAALAHENAAVRYWAAINLGNRASEFKDVSALKKGLKDGVPVVRFAAARALCKQDKTNGITVLEKGLTHEDSWVRLAAVQVLDEIGEQARGSIPAIQAVMEDENKYVVRVANHALNLLLGTQNVVR